MKIQTLPVGPIETNCHLAIDEATRRAVLLDPGDDAHALLSHLRAENLALDAILVTHGHPDHILALADLSDALPDVPVWFPAGDLPWAFTAVNALAGFLPAPRRPAAELHSATEGTVLALAGAEWHCLETPGHTPGGVCWHVPAADVLFTGDTLFAGSAGRTDLPGGDYPTLLRSLRRLAGLPGSPAILPGHGPASTLDAERRANPFLQLHAGG
jgi:glyoxylase-like metal-dependent hydrolase (beta-lactamase superfamily II)